MHPLTKIWKRREDEDPNHPPSTSRAVQSDLPQPEPASPHSSGSSSDSHSSGSPNSSSYLSPASGSKPSSGSQSIRQDSSPESSRHSLVSFALPPPVRSIPLKRHSPLNPTSLRDLPLSQSKPKVRPGINPLTQGSYRNGLLSAGSSPSGSRLHLNRLTTYGNVFFPRSSSSAARSSASSTLGGSTISLLSDRKHESFLLTKGGVFIPFPSDLSLVDNEPMNADDLNFTSEGKSYKLGDYHISARGWSCIVAIVILISAILALFIIYPVFSFFPNNNPNAALLNGNSTDPVKENAQRSIINARSQLPLTYVAHEKNCDSLTDNSCNRIEFHSGKYPSSILKAGVSEYEQGFSDEWEKEGRRFGPGTYTINREDFTFDQRTLPQTRMRPGFP